MELLDRYRHAVGFWLPKAQKKDVTAELSEDIRSEVEEKEAALGRKLSDGELAAVLKRRGSPYVVAQRYLPQRHLIGPALYPVYVFVLKLAALIYLVPWMAVWAFLVIFVPSYRAQHPGVELVKTLGTLWVTALYAFAWITIGFALAERIRGRAAERDRWDPRRLPRVRDTRRIPRGSSVGEIVFGFIFLLFWVGALSLPDITIPGTPPVKLTLGPVWQSFHQGYYAPIAALVVVGLALACVNLIRPYWTGVRLGVRTAVNAASAVILFAVLAAHRVEVKAQLFEATASKMAPSGIGSLERWINISVFGSLLIAAVICAVECARDIRRILQSIRPRFL
jgi:hypothetical protein